MNQTNEIAERAINTIRFLSVDAIQKANSGHPGMPMGCAPIAYLLYTKFMRHNPQNPGWINRDRFILSAGHGSMLLYSILHLCGYDLTLDDIKNFRQWKSITPGHPEYGLTPGVETTTGPLGQGFGNSVGMAAAFAHLSAIFNKEDIRILDHFIYVIASDGDMMEGVSHETASFAGHNKLGNLVVFYDNNKITIDGSLDLTMSEDVGKRFEAYGWHVQYAEDVNNLDSLESALVNAQLEKHKPSLIITNTHIGFGSPNKQDTAGVHGSPLGEEELKLTKQNLGWPEDKSFFIPDDVSAHFSELKIKFEKYENNWKEKFEKYKSQYPNEAALFQKYFKGNFDFDFSNSSILFNNFEEKIATRSASGKLLEKLYASIPNIVGGSADLTPSNNTLPKAFKAFNYDNFEGRYFHFGIREHAMGSMLNGMALYGGVIPYGGTFLIFSDYMRPAIRLASLSKINPVYVFTHDSIGLGEDGPTHQPVEHLNSLRLIPGCIVIRPADANETVFAWQAALQHKDGPTAIALTRQKLPLIDRSKYASAENTLKGAYILKNTGSKPELILIASGSEVYLALDAAIKLDAEGISTRVVSFPSWELFEMQTDDYKKLVLPEDVSNRVSIEAGVKSGWEKYVGDKGDSISIETFGASAPASELFKNFGFTVDAIINRAKKILNK